VKSVLFTLDDVEPGLYGAEPYLGIPDGAEWVLKSDVTPLLAAVEAMRHDIEILYGHHREPGNAYLVNLKAAIAKARGEAHAYDV
jgi:hypothetical protein